MNTITFTSKGINFAFSTKNPFTGKDENIMHAETYDALQNIPKIVVGGIEVNRNGDGSISTIRLEIADNSDLKTNKSTQSAKRMLKRIHNTIEYPDRYTPTGEYCGMIIRYLGAHPTGTSLGQLRSAIEHELISTGTLKSGDKQRLPSGRRRIDVLIDSAVYYLRSKMKIKKVDDLQRPPKYTLV